MGEGDAVGVAVRLYVLVIGVVVEVSGAGAERLLLNWRIGLVCGQSTSTLDALMGVCLRL